MVDYSRGELEVFVKLIDGLSILLSGDNLNDFMSSFGPQNSTDFLTALYKPSELYKCHNYMALMPPCHTISHTSIMTRFFKTGQRWQVHMVAVSTVKMAPACSPKGN